MEDWERQVRSVTRCMAYIEKSKGISMPKESRQIGTAIESVGSDKEFGEVTADAFEGHRLNDGIMEFEWLGGEVSTRQTAVNRRGFEINRTGTGSTTGCCAGDESVAGAKSYEGSAADGTFSTTRIPVMGGV